MNNPGVVENPARRRFFEALVKKAEPDPGVFERLNTNIFPSQGVIWAAEARKNNEILFAGDDGVIVRYDGETWRREPLNSELPIHALCRGNDDTVHAVGWLGLICERRNGEWRIVQGGKRTDEGDSADMVRLNLPLFDVAMSPSGLIWAVGDQGRVVCREGQSWREIDSGVETNLRCVLPLDNDAIMVSGNGGTVLHYSDNQWQRIETHTNCPIVSMAAADTENIYAVGGDYKAAGGDFVGHVFHYNGGHWREIEMEHPLPRLRRIRWKQDDVYIVGDHGTAIRINRKGATQLRTRVRYDLHDVVTTENGKALLCGDGGSILFESRDRNIDAVAGIQPDNRSQSPWKMVTGAQTNKTLRGTWAASPHMLFAVGDAGTILQYDGNTCSLEDSPVTTRLYGIWGTSANNVYAVGENSTILHFDGNNWTVCYKGDIDVALLAVTGFGPHDIYVVGDNGFALHFDGLLWHRIETGTPYELYALWGYDSNHVLAAGGAGVLVRWNGEKWQTFNAGTDNDIYGIWGKSLDDIYFCGLSSTLIHFSENAWNRENAGVRFDIHAVAGSQGGAVFAAGSQGIILQYKNGQWEPEQNITDTTLQSLSITDNTVFAAGSNGCILERQIK